MLILVGNLQNPENATFFRTLVGYLVNGVTEKNTEAGSEDNSCDQDVRFVMI
jgi:hypothetical protein